MKFDFNDNEKRFRNIFSYDFLGEIITNFKYYENQNEKIIFFVKKNSVEFFYLDLNELEYNMKQINLKKDYEIFNEENTSLKEIFIFTNFFLFFTNKDEFILMPNELLKIFKQQEEKKKMIPNLIQRGVLVRTTGTKKKMSMTPKYYRIRKN